jgi:PAS domain S-box-containing protein/putative nucleotidyltransferase with HDIG domain
MKVATSKINKQGWDVLKDISPRGVKPILTREYQAIFKNNGKPMVIVEEDATISLVNAEFEQLSGYAKEEIEGRKNWMEFVARDDRRRLKEYHRLRKADPILTPRCFEFRFLDRYEKVRNIVLTIGSIAGTNKSMVSLLDVTDRRQEEMSQCDSKERERMAEKQVTELEKANKALQAGVARLKHEIKELQESEGHYRTLMDNVDFGINLIDTDHTIVMANAVQNKRLSKAVSDVIGKKCFREFEKRDAVCSYCPGVRAMATSQPAEVESETIRDDGTRFPVRVQAFPIFGQDGTASGFIEVVEDITERKRAEEKLRESEGRYRTLVENIDFGINLIDAEYNVVMVNAALSKRVNKSVSELVGEKCYRVFEKRDTVCPNCPGVRAMATGQRAEVESAAPDDDPNDFSARVQAFPIFGQDGAASGFIEVVEDITERKKVQKALLEHKEALKNSFLGTTEALSKVIEDRDPYTSGHSAGVAGLAEAIAHALGFSEDQITGIYIAGVLHDIGKMAVPVEILVKPGSLNDMERSLIQIHPKAGYEILKGIDFPWPVAQATHQHHERMDGSGYPQGLKGGEIILEARILAVADVMDAMTHHRPYRPAFSLQDAIKEIKKGRGSLYDPRVVDACLEVLRGKEPWIISEYSTNSTSPHFPSRSKNSSVLPITTSMRASGRR